MTAAADRPRNREDRARSRTDGGHDVTAVAYDRSGLAMLDPDDCVRALHQGRIGCLALCHGALPLALPVAYAIDGSDVVFRAQEGTTLAEAAAGAVVSFCAHDDGATTAKWSVVVIGVAEVVTDRREVVRLEAALGPSWVPDGAPSVTFRLTPTFISGRRGVVTAAIRPTGTLRDGPCSSGRPALRETPGNRDAQFVS
jgi:uncharacterized protein